MHRLRSQTSGSDSKPLPSSFSSNELSQGPVNTLQQNILPKLEDQDHHIKIKSEGIHLFVNFFNPQQHVSSSFIINKFSLYFIPSSTD